MSRHKFVLEIEKHDPKGFPSSPTFGFATKDENGNSTYQESNTLPSCLAFVDGNAVPPTTNNNDVYVLIDKGNGAVNTDWDGASYNDFVRYSSGVWVAFNPFNGVKIFNKADNKDYLYNSGWGVLVPDAPTLYNQNGSIPATTNRTVTIPADSSLDLLGKVGIGKTPNTSAILDVSVSNKGLRLPQGNEAQMNAISTPADNLLYQRTDLNGALWRYDLTNTTWVPLTVGYGIIEVIRDSDNGIPTYYADLQTALETCKTSGSNNIVNIYSDIVLTTGIELNDGGTGVGSGYFFESLTIDLNGFRLSIATADSDNIINADLFAFATTKLIIKNGYINRTNSTTNSYALLIDQCQLYTSNLIVESNEGALKLDNTASAGHLGLCRFIGNGSTTTVQGSSQNIEDFTAINTGTGDAFYYVGNGRVLNFTAISNSGDSFLWQSGDAHNFKCHANSGNCLQISGSGTWKASNIVLESNTGFSVRRSGFGAKTVTINNLTILNGGITNAGSFTKFTINNFDLVASSNAPLSGSIDNFDCSHGSFISESATDTVGSIRVNNTFKHLDFIAKNTKCLNLIDSSNVNNSVFEHCSFTSEWDNVGGHSLDVSGIDSGTADFVNCTFTVANAGANNIYSSDAEEIVVSNSSLKGATTPINANVTITASTDLGNGNTQI